MEKLNLEVYQLKELVLQYQRPQWVEIDNVSLVVIVTLKFNNHWFLSYYIDDAWQTTKLRQEELFITVTLLLYSNTLLIHTLILGFFRNCTFGWHWMSWWLSFAICWITSNTSIMLLWNKSNRSHSVWRRSRICYYWGICTIVNSYFRYWKNVCIY